MGRAYLQTAACKCVHYGNVMARETARCGSLHLPMPSCRRTSYGRQWGATRTMARTRHHALRKTAENFAIVITYIRTPRDSWVELRMQRCVVCFMRKWQIRIAGEQRAARRFTLFTGRGYFIVLAKFMARGTPCVE